jgi:hypothetical protein
VVAYGLLGTPADARASLERADAIVVLPALAAELAPELVPAPARRVPGLIPSGA